MSGKPMPLGQNPVSDRIDWATPPEVFGPLNDEFGFTLDVCAFPHNAKVARYFTPDDDGAVQDWGTEVCWMNPPYGPEIARWMRKAYQASKQGATVVCLVPSRTDTRWWHDYAMKGEVRLMRGRVQFVGGKGKAPFPTAIIVFRPTLRSLFGAANGMTGGLSSEEYVRARRRMSDDERDDFVPVASRAMHRYIGRRQMDEDRCPDCGEHCRRSPAGTTMPCVSTEQNSHGSTTLSPNEAPE